MALKKRIDFFNSEEGLHTQQQLQAMVQDKSYNTRSTYSANTQLHADNLIPFVEKHMSYLNQHPDIEPRNYLSNLRLITRIRQ